MCAYFRFDPATPDPQKFPKSLAFPGSLPPKGPTTSLPPQGATVPPIPRRTRQSNPERADNQSIPARADSLSPKGPTNYKPPTTLTLFGLCRGNMADTPNPPYNALAHHTPSSYTIVQGITIPQQHINAHLYGLRALPD